MNASEPVVSLQLLDLARRYTGTLQWYQSAAAPDTLATLSETFRRERHIVVSSLHSHSTIWGHKTFNWRFRAWHDHTHMVLGADFDRAGEALVARVQVEQARAAGCSDRDLALLWADTEGQQDYYARHKRFPDNQRAFVLAYLENRGAALAKADW